ncbi:MAG: penicillin-binding transpeptidase domain-containing protein [Candidatus Gracilibacteria bacterium]
MAGAQDAIIDLANKMGIESLKKSHSYGYPLALGAGEVSLYEMVNAYATFANGGKRPELSPILKVENSKGDVLYEWREKEFEEVLDPQIAYLINSILSDRGVGLGPNIYVDGKTNAAKTGTSTKENKKEAKGLVRPGDNWTLGYTPTIATGVWVGNSDGTGLGMNADGYNTAAPVFKAVMTKALEGLPNEQFARPEGIKDVQISKASGKLPGSNTPPDMIRTDVFQSFAIPTEVDDSFYKVKIDKVSGLLATEYTPADAVEEVIYQNYQPIAPMFNWANEIKDYYEKKAQEEGVQEGTVRIGVPPKEYDNVHTADTSKNKPSIVITTPASHSTVKVGNVIVEVEISSPNGVKSVEYYVDDEKEYSTTTPPYFGNLIFNKFSGVNASHLIVAKIIDNLGYSSQSAIEVKIENDGSEDAGN